MQSLQHCITRLLKSTCSIWQIIQNIEVVLLLAVEVHTFHVGHVVVGRSIAHNNGVVAYKAGDMGIVVDLLSRFSDSVVVVVGRLARLNERMLAPKRNITVAHSNASVGSMRLSL